MIVERSIVLCSLHKYDVFLICIFWYWNNIIIIKALSSDVKSRDYDWLIKMLFQENPSWIHHVVQMFIPIISSLYLICQSIKHLWNAQMLVFGRSAGGGQHLHLCRWRGHWVRRRAGGRHAAGVPLRCEWLSS